MFKKQIRRDGLLEFIAQQPISKIGMEACGGAHHWARSFEALGHEVVLIAPQFVKPYVKGNKTDAADAEAIYEAMTRPSMRFVPIKTVEQQAILSMHRIRSRLVKSRTMIVNELRGLLHEYGVVFLQGRMKLKSRVEEFLTGNSERLTSMPGEMIALCYDLLEEWRELDERIKKHENKIKMHTQQDATAVRLMSIPGVGFLTASAMVASVGNATNFKSARHLSAWLGLVPKQHSSGGKERLLGISKRGDSYLRSLLVHGARSAMLAIARSKNTSPSRRTLWMKNVAERRGHNRAIVATANKTARIIWALLRSNEAVYDPTHTPTRCRGLHPTTA